jgi:hypothetical protein
MVVGYTAAAGIPDCQFSVRTALAGSWAHEFPTKITTLAGKDTNW